MSASRRPTPGWSKEMPTRRVPGSSVSFREGLDVVLEEVLVPLVVVLEEVVELVDTGAGSRWGRHPRIARTRSGG